MGQAAYLKFVFASLQILCGVVIAAASAMLIASIIDHLFRLGWGWDFTHSWMLLLVIAASLLIAFVCSWTSRAVVPPT
jgi:hypothetical protein